MLQSIAALSQARKTLVELLSTDSGQQREKTADGRRRGAGGQRSKKKRRTRDAEKKKKKGSVRGKTTGCEEKTADGRRPDEIVITYQGQQGGFLCPPPPPGIKTPLAARGTFVTFRTNGYKPRFLSIRRMIDKRAIYSRGKWEMKFKLCVYVCSTYVPLVYTCTV